MTVADFVALLAGGLTAVLPWVGAAVGAGIALFLTFLGIRAAFGFFFGVAEYSPSAPYAADPDAGAHAYAYMQQYLGARDLGWSNEAAHSSAEVAADLAVMHRNGDI